MVESNEIHQCATPRRARVEDANESTPLLPHNQIDREQSMKKLQALVDPVCRSQLRAEIVADGARFHGGRGGEHGVGIHYPAPKPPNRAPPLDGGARRGNPSGIRWPAAPGIAGDGRNLGARGAGERSSASRARGEEGERTFPEFERSVRFVRKRTHARDHSPPQDRDRTTRAVEHRVRERECAVTK